MVKFPGSWVSNTIARVTLELLPSEQTAAEPSTKGKGWPSKSHRTVAPSAALTTQVSVLFSFTKNVAFDGNSRNTTCICAEQREEYGCVK